METGKTKVKGLASIEGHLASSLGGRVKGGKEKNTEVHRRESNLPCYFIYFLFF
jgi:hypothetical protein